MGSLWIVGECRVKISWNIMSYCKLYNVMGISGKKKSTTQAEAEEDQNTEVNTLVTANRFLEFTFYLCVL